MGSAAALRNSDTASRAYPIGAGLPLSCCRKVELGQEPWPLSRKHELINLERLRSLRAFRASGRGFAAYSTPMSSLKETSTGVARLCKMKSFTE